MRIGIIGRGLYALSVGAALQKFDKNVRVTFIEREGELHHERGSSGGMTRAWRPPYCAQYDPLFEASMHAFRRLEQESGLTLLKMTGCLELGKKDFPKFDAMLASLKERSVSHRDCAQELPEQFAGFGADSDTAVFRDDCGIIYARRTIDALAGRLRPERTTVIQATAKRVQQSGERVIVEAEQEAYEFDAAVIAAGAGSGPLLVEAGLFPAEKPWATEESYSLFAPDPVPEWLDASGGAPGRIALFSLMRPLNGGFSCIWEAEEGLLKVVERTGGPRLENLEQRTFRSHEGSPERCAEFLNQLDPSVKWRLVKSRTCLYEWSPDYFPLVGRLPGADRVWTASLFTGGGFKFGPYLGEVLARQILGQDAPSLPQFDPARFA